MPKNLPADFQMSFLVSQTPDEVFAALVDVHAWWGAGIKGNSDKLGASFKYRHKEFHFSVQKVVEFVPGKKLVWKIEKGAQINFVKQKDEWDETLVVFAITPKGAQTEISIRHEGLTPKLECFKNCSGGWETYFGDSLKKLITTGKGKPDPASFSG